MPYPYTFPYLFETEGNRATPGGGGLGYTAAAPMTRTALARNPQAIMGRCNELQRFWAPRNAKMKVWYKLIQMMDELKTDKMESFVGNDPRAMYNLVLHMLDAKIPHRIEEFDIDDYEIAAAGVEVSRFLDYAWDDAETAFRSSGPRQSLKRAVIGMLLATGWYSVFSIISDDGKRSFVDIWNPAQVYPMWDGDLGLAEVAHIYGVSASRALRMARLNNWRDIGRVLADTTVYDYWWVEIADNWPFIEQVWNAVVVNNQLVKFEPTRFRRIPIYVAPVGGLPDTGPLSEGAELSTTFSAGGQIRGERWKEEIGQSIIATNENIYKTWNKWWTFSLQLLRDTAQPRVFEKSRSGKQIVRAEDVFRRGAIFRGGPDDSVEFIGVPPIPMEIRTAQLDLEAMMQRGGVSWAMHGAVAGQMTAYVMANIAASANQVMRPFQQALQNLFADIDNAWIEDIRTRGVRPYGWSVPAKLGKDTKITADFDVEIPGDLVQRATVARMLDPDFRLSYSYVLQKLFPEIKSPLQERAQTRADTAERHPSNALIALVIYYRRNAAYLEKIGDAESAKLYEMAEQVVMAQLTPQEQQEIPPPRQPIGERTEGLPPAPRQLPQGRGM